MYHISTKYWYPVSDFLCLVSAFYRAVGAGSVYSVDQYLVLLRYACCAVIARLPQSVGFSYVFPQSLTQQFDLDFLYL